MEMFSCKVLRVVAPLAVAFAPIGLARAIDFDAELLLPSSVFVQAGTAGHTRTLTQGLAWDWGKQWRVGPGRVTGHWEASLSEWSYRHGEGRDSAWLGQIGLIPVFRFRADDSKLFAEAGIGLTFMTNLYASESKRFSTRFNFGDHLAIGCLFGDRDQHELALRVEHFSNAGIRHPNPGENFVQLRYTFRLPTP